MNDQLGVGVIGLHEGRTLLVALTQPVPPIVGQTPTGVTRAPHGRAGLPVEVQPIVERIGLPVA